jgi:hypothetical protein
MQRIGRVGEKCKRGLAPLRKKVPVFDTRTFWENGGLDGITWLSATGVSPVNRSAGLPARDIADRFRGQRPAVCHVRAPENATGDSPVFRRETTTPTGGKPSFVAQLSDDASGQHFVYFPMSWHRLGYQCPGVLIPIVFSAMPDEDCAGCLNSGDQVQAFHAISKSA